MGNIFRPGDPRYTRKVKVISIYACTIVGIQTVMADHGRQEHVFTPLQSFINKKGDTFYKITDEELAVAPPVPPQVPAVPRSSGRAS